MKVKDVSGQIARDIYNNDMTLIGTATAGSTMMGVAGMYHTIPSMLGMEGNLNPGLQIIAMIGGFVGGLGTLVGAGALLKRARKFHWEGPEAYMERYHPGLMEEMFEFAIDSAKLYGNDEFRLNPIYSVIKRSHNMGNCGCNEKLVLEIQGDKKPFELPYLNLRIDQGEEVILYLKEENVGFYRSHEVAAVQVIDLEKRIIKSSATSVNAHFY